MAQQRNTVKIPKAHNTQTETIIIKINICNINSFQYIIYTAVLSPTLICNTQPSVFSFVGVKPCLYKYTRAFKARFQPGVWCVGLLSNIIHIWATKHLIIFSHATIPGAPHIPKQLCNEHISPHDQFSCLWRMCFKPYIWFHAIIQLHCQCNWVSVQIQILLFRIFPSSIQLS